VGEGEAEQERFRQMTVWQTLFSSFLETLDSHAQAQAAASLRAVLAEVPSPGGIATTGAGGVAAGRDIIIKAEGGSVAATRIEGGVHLVRPSQPDPSKG
jgi:hypothetical protein